eukprot:5502155-Lingulodinium_polyedra.AAC.1
MVRAPGLSAEVHQGLPMASDVRVRGAVSGLTVRHCAVDGHVFPVVARDRGCCATALRPDCRALRARGLGRGLSATPVACAR